MYYRKQTTLFNAHKNLIFTKYQFWKVNESSRFLFSKLYSFENAELIHFNIYFISIVLGISLLKVAAILSGPVAIVKTLISLVHAYVAAQNLAIIDGNEREIMRQNELAKKPE